MSLVDELRAITGRQGVLTDPTEQAPFVTDWRGIYHGRALAVVFPRTTDEVAAVVQACGRHHAPVVPQGGNTGQAGGATPDASGSAVVVVLTRLNRIRQIDPVNDTITLEAGCTQQAAQEAAAAAGRLFALSFGAKGSCTIGGNLATNAGGMKVLRYGNARELALGLEVVTAQGRVLNALRGLRKDNSGYDLRDLFIGSEGTLGIITAATMKLHPMPRAQCTSLVALRSLRNGCGLLQRLRRTLGADLTGFEIVSAACAELVAHHFPDLALPFVGPSAAAPWFALVESSSPADEATAAAAFEQILAASIEEEEADDALVAQSLAQTIAFWHTRESITLALAKDSKCLKHDISVPVSAVPEFVENTDALLRARFPGIRLFVFGHLGDGNLHYNVARPIDRDESYFLEYGEEVSRLVHDSVQFYAGSITAEQGIGQLRLSELLRYKGEVELDFMRRIKTALDPQGLLNPGKILAAIDPA